MRGRGLLGREDVRSTPKGQGEACGLLGIKGTEKRRHGQLGSVEVCPSTEPTRHYATIGVLILWREADMASDRPIGVFDSGLGGLTVARAIATELPQESIVYFGDTARCPYGERSQKEVRQFVGQLSRWFERQNVKLLVIACNTATAAGLAAAQYMLDIPVLGVIVPGARAVVQATHSRKVGVLATKGTCESGQYPRAIHALDYGVKVWQAPSPRSVEIVERAVAAPHAMGRDWMADKDYLDTSEILGVAQEDLTPLMGHGIDAVILGCTHFPLLKQVYQRVLGPEVSIVSSAEETAREVREYLARSCDLADATHDARYRFATTSSELAAFCVAGEYIFGRALESVEHVDVEELEALSVPQLS